MKQIIPRVQTTYLKCPTCTNSVTTVTNDRKYPLYPSKERRDWCGSCHVHAMTSQNDRVAFNSICISTIAPVLQECH